MKFYNRKTELDILETHYKSIKNGIILDVFMGRRRIGKTALVKQFIKNKKHLYFFVGRKPIKELLEEWTNIIQQQFNFIGNFNNLDEFLKFVFDLGKKQKLVIIFDEFQNFNYVYAPAFSIFQKFYDENHFDKKNKVLLLLLGSITTLMEKIFTSTKEPLFGRATRRINLRPLNLKTCSKIAKDLNFKNFKNIFNLYSIFNGVPAYYSILEKEGLQGQSLEKILEKLILNPESILKNEGEFLIREMFGKEHENYFGILSLIARGKTKIGEIASEKGMPVSHLSQYINNLEKKFSLIERRQPIFAKPRAKTGRYYLKDIFLCFWFRFVYPYLSLIEKEETKSIIKIIKRDLSAYQGKIFESMVKNALLAKSHRNNFIFPIIEINSWWDNKGENEVDIIAISEDKQEIFFSECKINPKRITQKAVQDLIKKSELEIFKKFPKKYLGFIALGKLNSKQSKQLKKSNIEFINLEQELFS